MSKNKNKPQLIKGYTVMIKGVKMNEDMQKDATENAVTAISKGLVEKDVASHMKDCFDKRYGKVWHCVVGRNFGSFVTHDKNNFIYFYVGQHAVLLFKTSSPGQ